jgi:N-acetylmuramoyl-L-alanine amidase
VRDFQSSRGLFASGQCDEQTWLALVEASWSLGDRLLLLTSPNLRGDDVAELQSTLGRLGFDCGRVDGILGPRTAGALVDFQRNCGLNADGVCGTDTTQALRLLARQSGSGPGVAAVREIETLRRAGSSLDGLRVVIGQFGGFSSLTRMIVHELRTLGAKVVTADEPEPATQAAVANRFAAAVYLGFDARAEAEATVAYYAVPAFESAGGRALATRLADGFAALMLRWPVEPHAHGMRLPVLRETRMPAVLCSLGPVRQMVDHAATLAEATTQAVVGWAAAPLPASTTAT